MKVPWNLAAVSVAALSIVSGRVLANDLYDNEKRNIDVGLPKRQGPSPTASGIPTPFGAPSSASTLTAIPAAQSTASGAISPSGDGFEIPPLESLTPGGAPAPTVPLPTIYPPGSTPPIPGAPLLPRAELLVTNYPPLDLVPPTDSDEVRGWMQELQGVNIPNFRPTVDGSCVNDTEAAQDTSRCWWTCGGCLGEHDITTCGERYDWALSFDDGPSPYTPKLLHFLNRANLKATFFVVGSRVIDRPQMVQYEYMAGHELSVHTWSHSALTRLTNEQIVAELGWTRKAIKDVTGVTPLTMRPPYGDIDNRVRAIALAMGMVPVMWPGFQDTEMDTKDWRLSEGSETPAQSFARFESFLERGAALSTGFVGLQHDLFQQTVDMAIGYTLPAALNHSPPFQLQSVNDCLNRPLSDSYLETNTNQSLPAITGAGGQIPSPTMSVGAGDGETSGMTRDLTVPLSLLAAAGVLGVGVTVVT